MWLTIALLCYSALPSHANCGSMMCGGGSNYYQAYQQLPTNVRYQVPAQPAPQQVLQYYYTPNAYQVAPPPATIPTKPSVLSSIDKETTVTTTKTSSYDDFEKELANLKPSITKEDKLNLSVLNSSVAPSQTITYIREYSGMSPEAYRPMPYRPVPYIPTSGCQPYFIPQQKVPDVIPAYVTAPPPPIRQPPASILPPPINDCCGKCGAPCKFRSKKNVIALASKIFTAQYIPRRSSDEEDEPKDPKCNSEKLKDLMTKYITRTVALSKRLIQKNAESELGGFFSVFCSTEDFSYVARSETFCQLQKNDIICYAFAHK